VLQLWQQMHILESLNGFIFKLTALFWCLYFSITKLTMHIEAIYLRSQHNVLSLPKKLVKK
jgi:hypothetical protein